MVDDSQRHMESIRVHATRIFAISDKMKIEDVMAAMAVAAATAIARYYPHELRKACLERHVDQIKLGLDHIENPRQ